MGFIGTEQGSLVTDPGNSLNGFRRPLGAPVEESPIEIGHTARTDGDAQYISVIYSRDSGTVAGAKHYPSQNWRQFAQNIV